MKVKGAGRAAWQERLTVLAEAKKMPENKVLEWWPQL